METRSIRDQLFREVLIERRTSFDLVAVDIFVPESKEWETTHYAVRDDIGKWMHCFGLDPLFPQEAIDRARACLEKLASTQGNDER